MMNKAVCPKSKKVQLSDMHSIKVQKKNRQAMKLFHLDFRRQKTSDSICRQSTNPLSKVFSISNSECAVGKQETSRFH
jgi:hypothetical protein